MKKTLICICCPKGCTLHVTVDEDRQVSDINGYGCENGREYGIRECTQPSRTVTSTVPVTGGVVTRVPVKTAREIPKELVPKCMEEIHQTVARAPVRIGDILIRRTAGTDIDVIATGNAAGKETGG
ncbi:DUF1667 domain-containing protein [Ruminococcus sp. OA3]|uniref:DUF1667 domain-containing protein n=1 Tax=Ruminococcus sp. OA3 TaxID=2914164 RepID=UPI001F07037F|nr:DUF1667 domain-containing protein [Ruminococcus sp. OA3]MCH1983607.1 DUF1667 domain-containing protein [Ruminococcus sp. OA3]